MVFSLSSSLLILGKIHASYRGLYDLSSSNRLLWILGMSALSAFFAYAFGLPEKPSLRTIFRTTVVATVAPVVVIALVQTAVGEFFIPRMLLLLSIPVNTLLLYCIALLSRRVESSRDRVDLACLLVADDVAERVRVDIAFGTEIPVEVTLALAVSEMQSATEFSARCSTAGVSVVVVQESFAGRPDVVECLRSVHELGMKVRTVTGFYDNYVGKVPVGAGELALPVDDPGAHRVFYTRMSRVADICVSAVGLIPLLVLIPIVTVGNLIGNRGPLFYSQARVGKGGTVFQMYKFRSMRAGGTTSQWTSDADARITAFGRLMRLTHIDELPQFWNILKGDLSLIGPRPEQPSYVEQLNKTIPRYSERHIIKPGLTGWAQVNYPYGASEKDSFEKLQYDLWYVKHQRLWVDVKIVARTFRHVAGMGGR